jgi:hypothetical protein
MVDGEHQYSVITELLCLSPFFITTSLPVTSTSADTYNFHLQLESRKQGKQALYGPVGLPLGGASFVCLRLKAGLRVAKKILKTLTPATANCLVQLFQGSQCQNAQRARPLDLVSAFDGLVDDKMMQQLLYT